MLVVLVLSERIASVCRAPSKVATGTIFNAFGMARPGYRNHDLPPAPIEEALPLELTGPVLSIFLYVLTPEGNIRRVPRNQVLGG